MQVIVLRPIGGTHIPRIIHCLFSTLKYITHILHNLSFYSSSTLQIRNESQYFSKKIVFKVFLKQRKDAFLLS